MIFFTEGKPVSKTPSPKYPHNLKTSSNVESVSESDEDDEREEVISYCYEGSIVLHWVLCVDFLTSFWRVVFLPQTFDIYVAKVDCHPIGGNKENFILKEGQFVEILDSVHPVKWLVRTKPSKSTPSRQGWLSPAYLEKKTKVSIVVASTDNLNASSWAGVENVQRNCTWVKVEIFFNSK